MKLNIVVLGLGCLVAAVSAATTAAPDKLKCRLCSNAKNLGDCTTETTCDNNEDCYMESIITDQLEIVFNGGCRATDVCLKAQSGVLGKRSIAKREPLIACSKCCDSTSGCNAKLCGIEDNLINASQCYYCDHDKSTQSEVEHPEECSTFTICQHDEFCYAGEVNTAGNSEYKYGCMKQSVCRILMKTVFAEYDRCYNVTDTPTCGGVHTRATNLCHACCGYGGCNRGSCSEINDRNYLYFHKQTWDNVALVPLSNATTPKP